MLLWVKGKGVWPRLKLLSHGLDDSCLWPHQDHTRVQLRSLFYQTLVVVVEEQSLQPPSLRSLTRLALGTERSRSWDSASVGRVRGAQLNIAFIFMQGLDTLTTQGRKQSLMVISSLDVSRGIIPTMVCERLWTNSAREEFFKTLNTVYFTFSSSYMSFPWWPQNWSSATIWRHTEPSLQPVRHYPEHTQISKGLNHLPHCLQWALQIEHMPRMLRRDSRDCGMQCPHSSLQAWGWPALACRDGLPAVPSASGPRSFSLLATVPPTAEGYHGRWQLVTLHLQDKQIFYLGLILLSCLVRISCYISINKIT